MAGCSILELFLLVAVERVRRKGQESPNFEMALHEYRSLRRGGGYRGVDDAASRPAAFRAFERLITANLLAYTDPRCVCLSCTCRVLQHTSATCAV